MRYPVPGIILACVIVASGCTAPIKEEVSQIARRVDHLESEAAGTRSELVTLHEDVRDQDLRLQFLEYEAVQRGEPIAPRRSMSDPGPAWAFGGRIVEPEPLTPSTRPQRGTPATSRPATTSPAQATTSVPVRQPEPSPVAPLPPVVPVIVDDLPTSPSSTASPLPEVQLPGTLPTPLDPPVETAETMRPGDDIITTPPTVVASLPPAATGPISSPSSTAPTYSAANDPGKKAYDLAMELYYAGKYAESEAAFQAFLEVYPNSWYVPNALYWKGETYYARNMFADAIFSFKDVQTRYPQNQKTPDSLLKTAMAYQRLGDTANASLHLTVLYEDWPNAEASQRARNMGLRP